jgi:hypothetical protein
MSTARKRKAAAKMLGIAIQQRLENLYDASASGDETKITIATVDMAQVMYDNAEFIIWALKSMGGLTVPPPETVKPIPMTRPPAPANDAPALPVLPSVLTGSVDISEVECTCPPLEAGIIGRDRHMTACPKFEPA